MDVKDKKKNRSIDATYSVDKAKASTAPQDAIKPKTLTKEDTPKPQNPKTPQPLRFVVIIYNGYIICKEFEKITNTDCQIGKSVQYFQARRGSIRAS